jgi:ADP-ribose pyrophosphatase YjhB (NUDIX family)
VASPGCYVRAVHTRVTGLLIEDDRILLLNQDTDGPRTWSLPGGKVEDGETLAHALVREMREETGAEVQVGRLLYLCDHVAAHVVHITFEVVRVGGTLGVVEAGKETRPIRGVEFGKLSELAGLGFSDTFVQLTRSGFPGAGSYMGAKSTIGL